MWRITSMKPRTARLRMCSSIETPAACIRSPPTPRIRNGAPRAASSRATLDACRSPDGSPATNRISRTRCERGRGAPSAPLQGRQRFVDLPDDPQGNGERVAPVLTGHDDRRLPLDRGDEALVLEPQRLALGRLEFVSLHELFDRLRVLGQLGDVEPFLELVELARSRREIERQISAGLKDAELPEALPRQPARLDAGDRAAFELQPGVGHVHAREHAGARGANVANATAYQRQH